MPTNYRDYEPEQSYLLPPSPSDWLPENHLAFFISEVVDEMDLSAFYQRHEQSDPRGNQPFHPAMMLKVLIYAYATGTFSARGIAQKIEEDVAYRVLAAGNFPQHRTICDFRREHLQTFLEEARERSEHASGLPHFVADEFERYLECGVLANG